MDMNSGAYSDRYKIIEREQIDSLKNVLQRDNIARGKKLSQENYRRRRAIAIKRKLEAQREEKRRQQILAQRREKQREATERFQRRNRSYRGSVTPESGEQKDLLDEDNPAPALDEALRAIRGSPVHRQTSTDSQGSINHVRAFSPSSYSSYMSTPGYNSKSDKYAYLSPSQLQAQQQRTKEQTSQVASHTDLKARSLHNLNSSRNLFEQQLHQQQQLLVKQQEKSLHDFNTAIMQEMLNDKKIEGEENDHDDHIETDSLSSDDSLNQSQDLTIRTNSSNIPVGKNSELPSSDRTESFHLTHDENDFALNKNGSDPNRTFSLDDRGGEIFGSDNKDGGGGQLGLSQTVKQSGVMMDQSGQAVESGGAVSKPSELSHEQDPAIYRTSAFQIHNKAWIYSDPVPDSQPTVLTSNSKPNSLRTTSTNATATHAVAKKGEFTVTSKPPQMIQSATTAQANNSQSAMTQSLKHQVTPEGSGTSKYSAVQNGSSSSSASQLHQPTVYSRIATKESVKQVSNGFYFIVPNTNDRAEEESIQDDVSSINSTVSNSNLSKGPEPELKVIRSILKKTTGLIPVAGKGIKSSGYGAMAPQRTVMQNPSVRDSLEFNKKVLEMKHERQERKKSAKKKGVRFADLTYEDGSSSDSGSEQTKETVYEVEREEVKPVINNPKIKEQQSAPAVSHKPPRPISARVTGSSKQVEKGSRASSAPLTRRNAPQGRIIQHTTQQAHADDGQHGQATHVRRTAFGETPSPSLSAPLVRKTVSENSLAYNGHDNSRPTENRIYGVHNNNYELRGQNGVVERTQEMMDMNGIPLDRTPTDAEINWLWDKVRTCLNRESSSASEASFRPPSGKLYIDGNTISPGQRHATRVAPSPSGQNKVYNNTTDSVSNLKRRAALLQQRSRQQQPNTLKNYKTNESSTAGYTATIQYPNPSSQRPSHATTAQTQELSESMAAFLTAETLSQQNVSDSQIHTAMDAAQRTRQPVNSQNTTPKETTMLSLEEQRLLQSLERLNERLRITEVSASPTNLNQPNVFSPKSTVPSGFKGHQPLTSHNRRLSSDRNGTTGTRFRTGSGSVINRTNYGRQY